MTNELTIELIKLALQLSGAFAIAFITVRLALKRYKSEKHWDRQIENHIAMITALSTMKNVTMRWISEEEGASKIDEERSKKFMEQYREASNILKLETALCRVIAPVEIGDKLKKFDEDYYNIFNANDYHGDLEKRWQLLASTTEYLVVFGRNFYFSIK